VHGDAVAALEEELAADDCGPGLDVDGVGGPVQNVVFAFVLQVENIASDDADIADYGTGRLEFGERWNGLFGGRDGLRRRRRFAFRGCLLGRRAP
jgi:hypothetical protein